MVSLNMLPRGFLDEDETAKEEDTADSGEEVPAAPTLQPTKTFLHMAERTKITKLHSPDCYVADTISGQWLHKLRAAAILSGHDKLSGNRCLQVRQTKKKKKSNIICCNFYVCPEHLSSLFVRKKCLAVKVTTRKVPGSPDISITRLDL